MRIFEKLRKPITFILALVISISTLLASYANNIQVVLADESSATKRVTTFIDMAAGKQAQDLTDATLELTKDELRFLGVYLSNFYVPFGTELGTSEQSVIEQTKADMKSALQTNLQFKDEITDIFVENIIGLSRSNNKELEFRVSLEYQKNYQTVPNFKVNYYNFLRLMLGQSEAVFEGYLTWNEKGNPAGTKSGNNIYKDLYSPNGKYCYGYFGYTDNDGNFIPMFDCGIRDMARTASQDIFLQCLASVDTVNGYGFSFFDFTSQEVSNDEELSSMLSSLSPEQVYKMSIYGSSMLVDCFGNIILKGGNHQYVIVPGCVNPYTWCAVKSDGTDNEKAGAGVCYNMISFMGMSLADTGRLIRIGMLDDEEGSGLKCASIQVSLANIKSTGMYMTGWGSETFTKLLGVENVEANKKVGESLLGFDAIGAVEETKESIENKKALASKIGAQTYFMPLRMLRGSSDCTTTGTFIKTKYFDLVETAKKGFKDANADDYSYYGSIYVTDDWSKTKVATEPKKYVGLVGGTTGETAQSASLKVIDNFIFIDNLGAFGFDDPESQTDYYSAMRMDHYLGANGETPTQLFGQWGADPSNGFTSMYKDIQSGKINTTIVADQAAIVGVYTTYALAGLYEDTEESREKTIGFLGFRMNKEGLIPITKDPITIPSEVADDLITKNIRDWVYYILNPEKGFDYVKLLITRKTEYLLVGWHNDMVGTNNTGATTGTTRYRSNVGYVTTPDLSEMEWTNSLLSFYNSLVPFLIIIMIVTMLFTYILGIMSLQKCAFGVVVFACFLTLPTSLINGVVGISNRVTQNLYGDRFTYWALVQQESYASALDKASSGDSYSNYLKTLYATNNMVYSNQGTDSIILKWQAPKKMASLMLSKEDVDIMSGLTSSTLLSNVLNRNAYSGESYLDGESSYLYRSYTDIGNFSRYIYNGLLIGNQPVRRTLSEGVYNKTSKSLQTAIKSMDKNYKADRKAGYTNPNRDDSKDTSGELRTIAPLSSKMYNSAISKKGKIKNLSNSDYVGINQDVFNFSVAMFNNSKEDFKTNLILNASPNNDVALEDYLNSFTYVNKDLSGLAAYSLMSESPFYYFSWALYDMGMGCSANATNGYKSLILDKDNGGFFYNVDGNGELKDFMDMKSLFTYIIPYLKEGNDLVREWDDLYGIFIYDGVPTEEGHADDKDIKGDSVLKQKYWHNLNVARLYEIYTPWVDLMYDCDYAKPEKIKVLGKEVTVKDPINPASYPAERPMVFSESEMYDYGLSTSDLTKVERLIIDCNKGMQERMYELLNYYNFSDLTLNTASAINCTFEFNTTFSDSGLFKDNVVLYPQTFEIADFSYDAFLRFILANSTGEDISAKEDFYLGIVQNSSMTTVIVMLVLDILSQYALPAFKVFFIIALFLSSILLILVTAFKVDPEQKFIPKLIAGLVTPMFEFLITTIGFAWVISLFMGVGNNAVTETHKLSISLGDPVVVMLAMCAVDIIVLIIYFIIIKGVVKDIISNSKLAVNFMGGVFGGVLSVAQGIFSHSTPSKSSGNSMGGGFNDKGTNVESPRAILRASTTDVSKKEEFSERVSNAKRQAIRQNKKEKLSPEETKERVEKLNSVMEKGNKNINKK